jgi:hypothetical protein
MVKWVVKDSVVANASRLIALPPWWLPWIGVAKTALVTMVTVNSGDDVTPRYDEQGDGVNYMPYMGGCSFLWGFRFQDDQRQAEVLDNPRLVTQETEYEH